MENNVSDLGKHNTSRRLSLSEYRKLRSLARVGEIYLPVMRTSLYSANGRLKWAVPVCRGNGGNDRTMALESGHRSPPTVAGRAVQRAGSRAGSRGGSVLLAGKYGPGARSQWSAGFMRWLWSREKKTARTCDPTLHYRRRESVVYPRHKGVWIDDRPINSRGVDDAG